MKTFNSKMALLQPYPFEKMAKLLAPTTPNPNIEAIKLSIGEPQHPTPEFIMQAFQENSHFMGKYPATKGLPQLREAIANWLTQRFSLQYISADEHVIPVSGTREAIFSFTQCLVGKPDRVGEVDVKTPNVVMPNPFYQIYEGATFLAGGQPYYVNCTAENNYMGDYASVPDEVWKNTQLVFICSPNNPTGAVMPAEKLKELIALSDKYDFVIASDECYSELYFDTPPVGLLEVCASIGRHDYKNCVVFHSLSKRSNVPGLRSGFIAGDADLLATYLQYRTYHGAALPMQTQHASIAAWQDETHVEKNRTLYQEKFSLWMQELGDVLPLQMPDAGFYFWLPLQTLIENTHITDDLDFTQKLYKDLNIHVLAGRYLSRDVYNGLQQPKNTGNERSINAGENHVRLALVADMQQTKEAVARLKAYF